MKRGLYILYDKLDDKGINKKITFQIKAFQKKGIKIDTFEMKNKYLPLFQLLARFPYSNILPQWIIPNNLSCYDFIYLRRPGYMNYSFIKWVQKIKKLFPEIKIIMEIPSYPYEQEYSKIKDIPFFLMDKHAQLKLKESIDYITTPAIKEEFNGVQMLHRNTLLIRNPYDFDRISLKKYDLYFKEIGIAIVARFCPWHGYERLIYGLKQYYEKSSNQIVHLHFVGDGREVERYKQLVNKLDINQYVTFYGFLEQEQICNIYNKCHIAADVFGGYKKGMRYSCSLKTREYLAVGLPIITAVELDISNYEELKKYILQFSNDDTPVDINKVVSFYNKIYDIQNSEELQKIGIHIRESAKKYLNYSDSMDSVIQCIYNK